MNLIGYENDVPYVVFEDVTIYRFAEDSVVFEEDDVVYSYVKDPRSNAYQEEHSKAPWVHFFEKQEAQERHGSEPEWEGEPCGHYQAGCGTSSYRSHYDSRDYSCFNTSCGGGYPSRSYGGCGGGCGGGC